MICNKMRGPEIVTRKIDQLRTQYKDRLGDATVLPVEDIGFVVRRHAVKPFPGKPWIIADYDDTLVETTMVKKPRLDLFTKHLHDLAITISDQNSQTIMESTDRFARWEDTSGTGDTYHATAHVQSLQWATLIMRQSKQGENDTTQQITETLQRIKMQLQGKQTGEQSDPFRFTPDDRILLTRKGVATKPIDDIFFKTLINPPRVQETVQALMQIGHDNEVNCGIFTYGDPYFQLLKINELLAEYPDLPVSTILLSRKTKGEFMQQITKTKKYNPFTDEINSTLQVSEVAKNVVIFLDDNPAELQSLLNAGQVVEEALGTRIGVIRAKTPGGREYGKPWGGITLDPGVEPISSEKIITVFQAEIKKLQPPF